jgi:FKBP-type peptidyl-prolyl cis-trans isomerase FklB
MLERTSARLDTDEQKVSYGFGIQFGDQLKKNTFEGMDLEAVIAGIVDWYTDGASQLSDAELNPAYQAIQTKQQAKQAEHSAAQEQIAREFMVQNSAREGVIVTDSGLQYEVLESGQGAQPELTSNVVVHYHGTLVDGSVFDSSIQRGEPATFGVTQVIPAWTEALTRMSVGDKWRLFAPPHLAYGEQGAGGVIPPNAALIFEVHLISIES